MGQQRESHLLSKLFRHRRAIYFITILFMAYFTFWAIPRGMALLHLIIGSRAISVAIDQSGASPTLGGAIWEVAPLPPGEQNQAIHQGLARLEIAQGRIPWYAHAHFIVGRGHLLTGQPELAAESYREYIKLRPTNPLGHLELGFALEITGDIEGAQAAWVGAGVPVDDYLSAGEERLADGNHNSARAWFRRATWVAPSLGAPWDRMAAIEMANGDQSQAEAYYLAAIQRGWGPSVNALTELYVENDRLEKAIELLHTALGELAGQERSQWYHRMGELLAMQDREPEAISVYQDGVEEFPQDIDLVISLARLLYDHTSNLATALAVLDRTMASGLQDGTLSYAYGELLLEAGHLQEADAWFEQAIERNPNYRWWHITRGNTARQSGDLELALEIYQSAIPRFPDFSHLHYQMAWTYFLLDRPGEAVTAIEKSLALEASPPIGYFLRAGLIYERAGENSLALASYRKALEIDPDNSTGLSGVQRLNAR